MHSFSSTAIYFWQFSIRTERPVQSVDQLRILGDECEVYFSNKWADLRTIVFHIWRILQVRTISCKCDLLSKIRKPRDIKLISCFFMALPSSFIESIILLFVTISKTKIFREMVRRHHVRQYWQQHILWYIPLYEQQMGIASSTVLLLIATSRKVVHKKSVSVPNFIPKLVTKLATLTNAHRRFFDLSNEQNQEICADSIIDYWYIT